MLLVNCVLNYVGGVYIVLGFVVQKKFPLLGSIMLCCNYVTEGIKRFAFFLSVSGFIDRLNHVRIASLLPVAKLGRVRPGGGGGLKKNRRGAGAQIL